MATQKTPVKKSAGKKSEEQLIKIVKGLTKKIAGLESLINSSLVSPTLTNAAVAVASNFSYSFELQNAKVLNLIVESFSQDNPPASGNFFAPVLDPNDPQQVRVIVVATQNNPGPVGSLSLKYKGKDLADNPIAIDFTGAMGSINKLVNLP